MSANSIAISLFRDALGPFGLTGPVFEKELRVASRRRWSYVLRFGYIVLVCAVLLSAWSTVAMQRGSMPIVYRVAQFGRLGPAVVRSVVVYQFLIVQLVAIALLSSSLSDEINSGTLSVLMTTPVSCVQIVMGKLLSRLLQVVLLVAISFPLLAILRVCGGIPWEYVALSVCVTLAAGVFAGALSLSLSLSCRHSHTVVVLALVVYLLIFGMAPGLLSLCETVGIIGRSLRQTVIALTNPFWQIYVPAYGLSGPSRPLFGLSLWGWHCLVLLGVSCVLLAASALRLRSAAVSAAYGARAKSRLWRRRVHTDTADGSVNRQYALRHPRGSPIVWKEMRKGLFGPGTADRVVSGSLIAIFALSILLLLADSRRNFSSCPYMPERSTAGKVTHSSSVQT